MEYFYSDLSMFHVMSILDMITHYIGLHFKQFERVNLLKPQIYFKKDHVTFPIYVSKGISMHNYGYFQNVNSPPPTSMKNLNFTILDHYLIPNFFLLL